MTASSRATAADLRWRRGRPRISRLESRTALARAGTPDSVDGSVHDDVDATLVAWPPLTTHLLRKQSQPDLWREKALDQPQAILRRPAPSQNENPIDLFASSRHGVARYHDDRHPPKQKTVGLPDPELAAHRPQYRAANQPFAVATLSPPIGAPLPGAVVSFAVIGSPASVVAVTASAESRPSAAFSSRVAGTSLRS